MSILVPLTSFALIITIAAAQTNTSAFPNCIPSVCDGLTISYPFWKIENENSTTAQYCGYEGLGINCSTIEGQVRPMMYFGGDSYYVRHLSDTSITLVDYDVSSVSPVQNECPRVDHGIDLERLPLNFTSNNLNLSFHFNCTTVPNFATVIPCLGNEGTKRSCVNVIHPDTPDYDWGQTCADEVVTTVLNVSGSTERLGTEFVDALRRGFELNLTTRTEYCDKCEESDGLCGYSHSTGSFMCFCSDGTSTRDHCKVIMIFTLSPTLLLSQNVQQFIDCSTKIYSCGPTIRWIGYPFWGQDQPSYCGLNEFHLACIDNVVATLMVNNTTFCILSIDQHNTKITLASNDMWGHGLTPNACLLRQDESLNNTTFEYTVFSYIPDEFFCLGRMSFIDYEASSLVCDSEIRVRVLRTLFDEFDNRETMPVEEMLFQGFPMEYSVGDFSVIDGHLGYAVMYSQYQRLAGLRRNRWFMCLTTPMSELMKDDTVEAIKNVKSAKELWDSLESKYMADDASSKKFLVSNFNNHNMVDSRPVMEQFNELLRILGQYTQRGLKMDESISISSVIDKLPHSWKDFKHTLKHEEGGKNKNNKQNKGKNVVSMRTMVVLVPTRNQSWNVRSVAKLVTSRGIAAVIDAIAWWIDSGATTHVCKDRCWFKTYEPVEDESILYMGDDHFAPVHGKGSVVLEFSSGKSITLFNVLYVPKLRKNLISGPVLNKCGYKKVYESDKYILSKSDVFVGFGYYNNGMFMLNLNKVPDGSVYMSSSTVVNSSLWHARLGHVNYKRMLEISKDDLIPVIDENPGKCTICNKKHVITFIDDVSRAVVRLPDPKKKTLGEKGIDCIFVGYAEHSKAYRPKDIIPNLDESQRDDHSDDVSSEIPKPRKVDKTKKFLSSKFSIKDMGETDVIFGVKIKRENKGIVITQSHYIEKILKKFNREVCSPVSTLMDPVEKLKQNTGKPVDQLEYSRAIGCLMYAMKSTRPDIAYAVGRVDGARICSRCESSGGTCWSSLNSSVPSCLCPDGIPRMVCQGSDDGKTNSKMKLLIGGGSAVLAIVFIFIIYCIRKSSSNTFAALFRHKTEDDKSIEAFVMQYGSLTTKRYKYHDIKKITNSFQVKLGQGGFGTVYKGKLRDGRLVAVKVLNSSRASGQEFINEVASIDLFPKIADFGLAKLYSRNESIVSMLEARGTIGYIAPEVFNRNFGGVSHKSDVYSYGMLILEMIGGRNKDDVGVGSGNTSEIYFPNWIYSRLKRDEYLLDGVTTEENDYARKMTIVGLWCIQTDPKQRPAINEVIEMLEGSTEVLEVPPKPYFCTPPRSPASTFSETQKTNDRKPTDDICVRKTHVQKTAMTE
nr:protein kinase-like domain-containing protein [Tanacetum cinerariifolium]